MTWWPLSTGVTPVAVRKMQGHATVRSYVTPTKTVRVPENSEDRTWRAWTLMPALGNAEQTCPSGRQSGSLLTKLDTQHVTRQVYCRKTKYSVHTQTCSWVCTAAWLTIIENWKCKILLPCEWNESWYIHLLDATWQWKGESWHMQQHGWPHWEGI